jgi:hypothetical protein
VLARKSRRHFQGSVEGDDQDRPVARHCCRSGGRGDHLPARWPPRRRRCPSLPRGRLRPERTPDVANAFFLVDPLDGTKEFIRKGNDFTVNIGLIEGDRRRWGSSDAPALSRLFAGDVTLGLAWTADVAPGVREYLLGRRPMPGFASTATAFCAAGIEVARHARNRGLISPRSGVPTGSALDRRSRSPCWLRAKPTVSIRGPRRPWSGTPPRAMPCCVPRVGGCSTWTASHSSMASRGSSMGAFWRQRPSARRPCGLSWRSETGWDRFPANRSADHMVRRSAGLRRSRATHFEVASRSPVGRGGAMDGMVPLDAPG